MFGGRGADATLGEVVEGQGLATVGSVVGGLEPGLGATGSWVVNGIPTTGAVGGSVPLVTCLTPPGVGGVAVTVGLMVNGLLAEVQGLGASSSNSSSGINSGSSGWMEFTYVSSPSVTSVHPMYGYESLTNTGSNTNSASVSTTATPSTPSTPITPSTSAQGQGLGQGSLITVQGKDFPTINTLLVAGNYTSSLSMLLCVFGGPMSGAGAGLGVGAGSGIGIVQYPRVFVRAVSIGPSRVTCQVPPLPTSITSTSNSNNTSFGTTSSTTGTTSTTPTSATPSSPSATPTWVGAVGEPLALVPVPFSVVADHHESLPLFTGEQTHSPPSP